MKKQFEWAIASEKKYADAETARKLELEEVIRVRIRVRRGN